MLIKKLKQRSSKKAILDLMSQQRNCYIEIPLSSYSKSLRDKYIAKKKYSSGEKYQIYQKILNYQSMMLKEAYFTKNPTRFLDPDIERTELRWGARFLVSYYTSLLYAYLELAKKYDEPYSYKEENYVFWREQAAKALVKLYYYGYDLLPRYTIPDEDSGQLLKELPAGEVYILINNLPDHLPIDIQDILDSVVLYLSILAFLLIILFSKFAFLGYGIP